ncbi:hypothetical protein FNF28_03870 [Cafeteria roenbergensis]|nr:hypothetical protein FNF28_03870 [Cafeteria roenbergensis]
MLSALLRRWGLEVRSFEDGLKLINALTVAAQSSAPAATAALESGPATAEAAAWATSQAAAAGAAVAAADAEPAPSVDGRLTGTAGDGAAASAGRGPAKSRLAARARVGMIDTSSDIHVVSAPASATRSGTAMGGHSQRTPASAGAAAAAAGAGPESAPASPDHRSVAQAMPAVITLDISMPRCDGFEAMRLIGEMVAAGKLPAIPPVIAVTGNATQSDTQRMLDLGAIDVLHKPIDPDALLVRINRVPEDRRSVRKPGRA